VRQKVTKVAPEGGHDDDEELAARTREGDESAWEVIVMRNYDDVWDLSVNIMRDRTAAEDVLQDTFLAARRKLEQYRGECPLRNWIFTICRNRCRDEFRRRGRRSRDVSMDSGESDSAGRPVVVMEGAEDAWVRRQDLDRALDRLGDEEREAFVLMKAMEYSSEKAAKLVGVAPSTMRSRLGRAREQLATWLDEYRER
jgi:RNA polymerase sigma-70 factor (ECF subfamily)